MLVLEYFSTSENKHVVMSTLLTCRIFYPIVLQCKKNISMKIVKQTRQGVFRREQEVASQSKPKWLLYLV